MLVRKKNNTGAYIQYKVLWKQLLWMIEMVFGDDCECAE